MAGEREGAFCVVAPIFPVTDVLVSTRFYADRLMFDVAFEWADGAGAPVRYVILRRGDAELHLSASDRPHKAAAYIFVDGIQAYHQAVVAAGAPIAVDLQDQPWDMREFEVHDPDRNVLIFGEHIDRLDGDRLDGDRLND